MNVGIMGSGVVATALGEGFLKHGHQVMLGTRAPEKLAEWKAKNPGAQISGLSETAEFAELVVLAVKGSVAAEALQAAGLQNLAGKVVIDATNPIEDGFTALELCRNHYREAGLDVSQLDLLVR